MKKIITSSIIEKTNKNIYNFDLHSKLLKERIIFLVGEISDDIANSIINQLLFLESENATNDINIYINSNGGNVSSGMAIYDTMNYIKSDISTLCIGVAFSMGAFLLSSGKKGKRYSMPNARLMIHQPLGGSQGQVSDIIIHTKEIYQLKKILTKLLSYNTEKNYKKLKKDTNRDKFMSSIQALDYGLIDHILLSKD